MFRKNHDRIIKYRKQISNLEWENTQHERVNRAILWLKISLKMRKQYECATQNTNLDICVPSDKKASISNQSNLKRRANFFKNFAICTSEKTHLNVDLRRNISIKIGRVDFRKFTTIASFRSTTDALLRKLSRALLISLHTEHICPPISPAPWNRLDTSSLTILSNFFRTLISSSSIVPFLQCLMNAVEEVFERLYSVCLDNQEYPEAIYKPIYCHDNALSTIKKPLRMDSNQICEWSLICRSRWK